MPTVPLADMNVFSILLWSGVLIVLAGGAFFGVKALTQWMREEQDQPLGVGFTLSDLRQLHKSGQMSSEEFEKAKAILLAAAQKPNVTPKSTDRPPL